MRHGQFFSGGGVIKSLTNFSIQNPYNNCAVKWVFFSLCLSEYTKIDVGWGFAQTPLGSLQRSPRPPNWFQGGRFAAGGEWREGLGKGEGEGKGEWGREEKMGELVGE